MNINSTRTPIMHHPIPHSSRLCRPTGLVLALLVGGTGLALGQTSIPNIINYQGRLTDNLGNPVTPGPYEVTFKIWNDLSSQLDNDYIWGSTFPVNVVSNGLFNVLLTDGVKVGNPRTNAILYAFEGDKRYLGLTITKALNNTVSPQVEITPRQRLVSAPFAINSYNATYSAQADYATTSSNATFASFADSASKFGNFNTQDFLMVNKPAQTLNGNLTMRNLIVNGSLGINTDNPSRSLEIQKAGDVEIGLKSTDANGHLWTLLSGGVTGLPNTDASFQIVDRTANQTRLLVGTNGNVGIGNTNPNYKLSFGNDLGDKVSLYGSSGAHYGLGITNYGLQIHSDVKSSDVIFGYGQSTNLTETFRIKGSGAIQVAGGQTPIVIRRYPVPTPASQGPNYYVPTPSYSYTNWSAAVIGFTCAGDFPYSGAVTDYLLDVSMQKTNGNWVVQFDLQHHSTLKNINVDVMYIRRELTDDNR